MDTAIARLAAGVALFAVQRLAWAGENAMLTVRESAAAPPLPADVIRLDYTSRVDGVRDWALARPPATGGAWVVVLHGHGSHGDQLYTRADITEHWLGPLWGAGLGLLTPNLRDNAWMSPPAVDDLHDLVGWTRRRFKVGRFLFLSGSMGGTGNLIYAALHPEDCAAVAALGATTDLTAHHDWCMGFAGGIQRQVGEAIEKAYGGPPAAAPERYRRHSPLFHADRLTMPIFLSHGESDALMPVDGIRQLAAQLKDRPDVVYLEIPHGNHDSPLFTRTAMEWLLRQAGRK
jgi:dipeptidyl aminopeptidase/acylaminoacyl peptidase